MTQESLKNLFLKRSSHRKYMPDPVPEADIRSMVDAARIAPSAHNMQPWRFLAITRKDLIEKIADVSDSEYQRLIADFPQDDAEKARKFAFYVSHFREAPLIFAVLSKKSEIDLEIIAAKQKVELPETKCFDLDCLGVGAVIENLLLSAEVMGYGTCWVAAPVMYAQRKVEELIGVKDPWHFVSLISVTRPVRERKSAPKKDLQDILTILS